MSQVAVAPAANAALVTVAAEEASMPGINTIWWQPKNNWDTVDYAMLFIRRDTRPEGTGIAAGGGEDLLLDPWKNTFLMQDLLFISLSMLHPTDKADLLRCSPDLFDKHAQFDKNHWTWFVAYIYPKIRSHKFTNEWCTYALIGVIKTYLPHYMWTGNLLLRGFGDPNSRLHERCSGPVTRSRAKTVCCPHGAPYRLVQNSSKILFDRIMRVLQFDDSDIFYMYDGSTYGEPLIY